jgi:hypothetical protein
MGEEVERLRGQVGALRREVWFTRRRDHIGGMELGPNSSVDGQGQHPTELVRTRRLSGIFPNLNLDVNKLDSTTKQIVKL